MKNEELWEEKMDFSKGNLQEATSFLGFSGAPYNWTQKKSQVYMELSIPLAEFGSDNGGKMKMLWQVRKYLQIFVRERR